MDKSRKEWLKRHFREVEREGSSTKRIKFNDIRSTMSTAFPDNPIDNRNLSDAIKDAFPNSLSKRSARFTLLELKKENCHLRQSWTSLIKREEKTLSSPRG